MFAETAKDDEIRSNIRLKSLMCAGIGLAFAAITGWTDSSGTVLQLVPLITAILIGVVATKTFLRDAGSDTQCRWLWSLGLILAPLCLVAFLHFSVHGYTAGWFEHPVAKLVYMLCLTWTVLGSFLVYKFKTESLRAVTTLLFVAPTVLAPLLGPATIAILDALLPVFTQSR